MEEGDLELLGIKARNRKVRDGLIRARGHLGIRDRAVFARVLNEATNGEGPDESTYNRWEHEENRIIPGWALDVAAQVTGLTVDQLLTGQPAAPEQELRPDVLGRLEHMEGRLQSVLGQLEQLGPVFEELKRLRRSERARRGRSTAANG